MLVPELGVALLNIPKCGSSTLRQCLKFHIERKKATPFKNPYINHLTLSELKKAALKDGFDINSMKIVTVVRNPIDRFLSGLNYYFADRYSHSLDKCVSLALENNHHREYIAFRPMTFFVDTDLEGLKIFPFEKITEAARSFGYSGIIPYLNKSRKRFSKDQLEPYMENISSFYKDDFNVYNTVSAAKEIKLCMSS